MSERVDTRAAILALLNAGESPAAVAKTLSVSRTKVYLVKKKLRQDPTSDFSRARDCLVVTPRVLGGLKKRIRPPRRSPCGGWPRRPALTRNPSGKSSYP